MKGLAASVLLILLLITTGMAAWPGAVAGADASPGASPRPTAPVLGDDLLATGDPRSEGDGPGIVGSPLAILLGVVLLGLASAGATLLLVRLRSDPEDDLRS